MHMRIILLVRNLFVLERNVKLLELVSNPSVFAYTIKYDCPIEEACSGACFYKIFMI